MLARQVAALEQQLTESDAAQQHLLSGMRDDVTFWQRRALAAEVPAPQCPCSIWNPP